ncbi:uncharacterized protein TEOVI_000218800 [Trypanosoma equiperdum]|uniref:Uncharacterized protein n=1 Tax=Trypanosoma equiperdum TaxID=5694 RepID=A0A1G4IEB4_TRYEQ|nr:hypothetical protein, conserved [Trypanosoma equiperdum]
MLSFLIDCSEDKTDLTSLLLLSRLLNDEQKEREAPSEGPAGNVLEASIKDKEKGSGASLDEGTATQKESGVEGGVSTAKKRSNVATQRGSKDKTQHQTQAANASVTVSKPNVGGPVPPLALTSTLAFMMNGCGSSRSEFPNLSLLCEISGSEEAPPQAPMQKVNSNSEKRVEAKTQGRKPIQRRPRTPPPGTQAVQRKGRRASAEPSLVPHTPPKLEEAVIPISKFRAPSSVGDDDMAPTYSRNGGHTVAKRVIQYTENIPLTITSCTPDSKRRSYARRYVSRLLSSPIDAAHSRYRGNFENAITHARGFYSGVTNSNVSYHLDPPSLRRQGPETPSVSVYKAESNTSEFGGSTANLFHRINSDCKGRMSKSLHHLEQGKLYGATRSSSLGSNIAPSPMGGNASRCLLSLRRLGDVKRRQSGLVLVEDQLERQQSRFLDLMIEGKSMQFTVRAPQKKRKFRSGGKAHVT